MFNGNSIIAYIVVGDGAVVIPWSFSFFDLFKDVEPFSVIPVLNVIKCRTHILFVLAFRSALRLMRAIVITKPTEAPRVLVLGLLAFSLTLVHNNLIRLLNFLKFFFIGFLIRVAYICVRMIFAA